LRLLQSLLQAQPFHNHGHELVHFGGSADDRVRSGEGPPFAENLRS
jgi:hypothetical protein